ncbi:MAG: zinc-binding dehydrogenase [Albidovulum sp.]
MSGVQLIGHGGPERLVWSTDLPVPVPDEGEVLVQVLAAGVNATDINTRKGWYAKADDPEAGGWSGAIRFPRIQGSDLCGRVVRHGPGVSAPPLGARVICPTNQAEPTADNPLAFRAIGSEYDGAFAEFCVVPARHLHDVSASVLSDIEIGAMPCAYGTAWNLMTRAGLKSGERVLVTGASGGVGYAAVQLAVLKGAIVTAQCAAAKAAPLRDAGARILDRDATPPRQGFDVVIDVVGGAGWNDRLTALRPGGRYATSGAIAGPMVEGDLRTVYLNDLTLFGCTHQPREVFAGLVTIINTAAVRPLIAKVYPLREIVRAQEAFESKHHAGKIVLVPGERKENG